MDYHKIWYLIYLLTLKPFTSISPKPHRTLEYLAKETSLAHSHLPNLVLQTESSEYKPTPFHRSRHSIKSTQLNLNELRTSPPTEETPFRCHLLFVEGSWVLYAPEGTEQ